jgi:hypothetical protein
MRYDELLLAYVILKVTGVKLLVSAGGVGWQSGMKANKEGSRLVVQRRGSNNMECSTKRQSEA